MDVEDLRRENQALRHQLRLAQTNIAELEERLRELQQPERTSPPATGPVRAKRGTLRKR